MKGKVTTQITTICPCCGATAYYYPASGRMACIKNGWLKYNLIPPELSKLHKPLFNFSLTKRETKAFTNIVERGLRGIL